MKRLFQEVRERNIRKFLAIYVSASITALGLVHLFSFRYHLPSFIFDSLLVILIFGIFNVFIFGWYHGKEGKQKFKPVEFILHTVIIIFAVVTAYFFSQRKPIKILPLNAKTVAVLPFKNMSDSKEDEYFSDGLTDDILTHLSKISGLQVISRTSVMKYKNTDLTIPEIGRELGAGSILEGSVRREGNKLRITAQLINASNDEHIWAETYDRNMSDVFEVQTEIAELIAKNLEVKLAPKEKIQIETKPTNNIEAYAFYLKGKDYSAKYTKEDNERAIDYFKKALAIDSNYALAYAGLASVYDEKVSRYFEPPFWRDSAIAFARRALEINPDLPEGHFSVAKIYAANGNYKLAKFHYEKAIRLNPNYSGAIYNLGTLYYNEGHLDKAYGLIRKSIILKPDDVFGYIVLGGIFQKLDCNGLALYWLNKAMELDPQNPLVYFHLINQHIMMQNFDEATKYVDKLLSIAPSWPYSFWLAGRLETLEKNYRKALDYFDKMLSITGEEEEYDYGFLLLKLGKKNKGKKIIERDLNYYLTEMKETSDSLNLDAKTIADIYAILGEKPQALFWLNKAVEKGWIEYRPLAVYPYLDAIKSEPEYQKLISLIKEKSDSIKSVIIKNDETLTECY